MDSIEKHDMILLMGLTGAGKSFFINRLTGLEEDVVEEGHVLKSCTTKCKVISTSVGNTDVAIIDCPGFDDTVRSDTDVLQEISTMLTTLYVVGLKLRGIVYLHRITDVRMQGTNMKNLNLFTKLVGEKALTNVVFATTMWGRVASHDMDEANSRDSELREEYWADFIRMGASATRFDGSQASAEGILSQILGKKEVVLKVQHELVDARMSLKQTAAGAFLEPTVHKEEAESRARVVALQEQMDRERDSGKKLDVKRSQRRAQKQKEQRQQDIKTLESKPVDEVESKLSKLKTGSLDVWKTALQALAAVMSITVTIVGLVM